MVHIVSKCPWCVFVLISLILPLPVMAGDTGCFTCHQYPGLVRLEKTGEMKVLHIDSEAYFKSPHAELGCRECHAGISSVPHAGEDKTTCITAQCHASKEGLAQLESGKGKKIHAGQQSALSHIKAQSSCDLCHPIYPHSKEVFARVVLNLHTTYIICEVCHYKKEEFESVSYDWISTDEVQFFGKPYGSYYDPRQQKATSSTNSISRIAPYVYKDGKKILLMTSWDMLKTRIFEEQEPELTLHQKNLGMRHLHRDIGKMEVIEACDTCHAKQGMLDFRRLGFSETRIQQLQTINTKGILQKYETFHMPQIFKPAKDRPTP